MKRALILVAAAAGLGVALALGKRSHVSGLDTEEARSPDGEGPSSDPEFYRRRDDVAAIQATGYPLPPLLSVPGVS